MKLVGGKFIGNFFNVLTYGFFFICLISYQLTITKVMYMLLGDWALDLFKV